MMKYYQTKTVKWVIIIGGILLIPLVAMQFTSEVNWSISDFAIMGLALTVMAILYEYIIATSKLTIYKSAMLIGIVTAFLLFWINGAVGIIGSENQDVNLLFTLTFVVGAVGALISNFKAKGMQYTLIVLAGLQLLIPCIALLAYPPSSISWSPGIMGVFVLCGVFSLLFLISGMLFRKAASTEASLLS